MANYFYTAKSFEGTSQTGVLNATDERELAQTLKSQGLMLVKAVLQEKKEKGGFSFKLPIFGVNATEKIMMTRNLGVMFSTGLPLIKSFDILSRQSKNTILKAALLDIKEKINKGENLSDALSRYPNIFSELFVNMIKVGEESGTLDDVFQILSLQLTKEHELKSKIKNAMIYPGIIMAVMLVIGGIVITFVLPSLNIFFNSLNAKIPFYTRLLLDVGNFLTNNWYLLILMPILLVGGVVLIFKTKRGKYAFDTLFIKTPIISGIVKKNNSASLIRSLSSLIASGVPLIRALEITSKTAGNHYFQEAIIDALGKIKKGEKLSSALKLHQHIFPFGVVEIIEVGEETGQTSTILKKLADFYEQEAVASIEKLTIIIEPMLIIFLGLAVAFFAFSIIEPMYSSLKFVNQ